MQEIKFEELRDRMVAYAKKVTNGSIYSEDMGHDSAVKAYMGFLDKESPMYTRPMSDRMRYMCSIAFNYMRTSLTRRKYALIDERCDANMISVPEYVRTVKIKNFTPDANFGNSSSSTNLYDYTITTDIADFDEDVDYHGDKEESILDEMKRYFNDKELAVFNVMQEYDFDLMSYKNLSAIHKVSKILGMEYSECLKAYKSIRETCRKIKSGSMSGARQCSLFE